MALANAGAWLTEWAAGREWAVQSFVALSGVALLSVVLGQRLKGAAAATDTKASAAMKREFHSFQRSYLGVFVVVMLADWLQGTHMYTLYDVRMLQPSNRGFSFSHFPSSLCRATTRTTARL